MTLKTLMQPGPLKANELFARLLDTPANATAQRATLFAELKGEIEQHATLEEQFLLPVLRRSPAEKDLATETTRETRDLRAKLAEAEALDKKDEAFLDRVKAMQKAFKQHGRDAKGAILPVVQRALAEEEKVEADQARAEIDRQARATVQKAVEASRDVAATATKPARMAVDTAQQATRMVAKAANEDMARQPAARAATASFTEMFFWPWMAAAQAMQGRDVATTATTHVAHGGTQEVIPLGEEVLDIGKRTVSRGTARIRRYVVEAPVEQQVTLSSERVVVERRVPVGETPNGEILTDVTLEVVETAEVPVVAKRTRLREEIVVRTERTQHVETVRGVLRHDEVEILQDNDRPVHQLRAAVLER